VTKFYTFHDAQFDEDFVVWASSEMSAWNALYCADPDWADTQVSFIGEVSFEEQKSMKQFL